MPTTRWTRSSVHVAFGDPEHADAAVQAVRENVVGRQRHQRVVVDRIYRHGVRGAGGDRRGGGREPGGVDGWDELHERLTVRIDHAEHRAGRVGARGEVVPVVAGIEPHLVVPRYSFDVLVDAAGSGVHD